MVRVFEKIDESPSIATHGQVATKPHIVDLILDLVGYSTRRNLTKRTLLDPGAGEGAFLIAAAQRLLSAAERFGVDPAELGHSLLAVEKDAAAADKCAERLIGSMTERGLSRARAKALARQWIVCDDFLASDLDRRFDFVVGNPPYVRQEAIPKADLLRYRQQFACFYDRADLYVAFFERGLQVLSDANDAALGFICPNRFCRNKYGKYLRALITERYRLSHVVDLSQASPFDPEVISYPAIFIVERGQTSQVNHVCLVNATPQECKEAFALIADTDRESRSPSVNRHVYSQWFSGEARWTTESPRHLEILHSLEAGRSPLGSESSGTTVGIGVATGADRVFIVRPEDVDVERELLLPLVRTQDILSGKVKWSGYHTINPFTASGALIDLRKFPRAKKYFERHREQVSRRNVAKRNADGWFRTIDRIYPNLQTQSKLLIPDIKATNHVVFENGQLYPHHNLYYVVSQYWNLQALQTILRSSIARFSVGMHCVKMRAGYLRFQAQYLRRIPLPNLMSLSATAVSRLRDLSEESDISKIDATVAALYGLSADDLAVIQRPIANGDGDE